MDPLHCDLQDVIPCNHCKTPVSCYSVICRVKLFNPCVGEHLSDQTKEHIVVPFSKKERFPGCLEHP